MAYCCGVLFPTFRLDVAVVVCDTLSLPPYGVAAKYWPETLKLNSFIKNQFRVLPLRSLHTTRNVIPWIPIIGKYPDKELSGT
jgi:hypothetical protein